MSKNKWRNAVYVI